MKFSDAIAALALVVSVSSISFTIWTWRRSGAAIRLNAFKATMVGHGPVMILGVRNAGRAPAWIDQREFLQSDRRHGVGGPWVSGPPLPHRLDAGASAAWALNYTEARAWMASNFASPAHHWVVRAAVRLGSSDRFKIDWHPVWIWEQGYVGSEIPPRMMAGVSQRQRLWLYLRYWLKRKDPVLRFDGHTWVPVKEGRSRAAQGRDES